MTPQHHRQLNTLLVVMLLMTIGTLYYIINHKIDVSLEHCEERLFKQLYSPNTKMYRDLFKEEE